MSAGFLLIGGLKLCVCVCVFVCVCVDLISSHHFRLLAGFFFNPFSFLKFLCCCDPSLPGSLTNVSHVEFFCSADFNPPSASAAGPSVRNVWIFEFGRSRDVPHLRGV